MIDIDFKFRPVGQGAFYSGVFKHRNGKQFSFVYDCGSDSTLTYIENEVDIFAKETSGQKIDILIISHFHRDHINRISYLLDKTGGAKLAILPYLTPEELILAYTDAVLDDSDTEPDVLSFIQNPVNFLIERKVEKIIYIHPDNEAGSVDTDNPNIKDVDPDSPDFDFLLLNELKPHPQTDTRTAVHHFYDTGNFSLVGFWEFKFYNKPRDLATIAGFALDVKNLLGITTFTFNDLSNHIYSTPSTFESDFNTIYSKHFGAGQLINDTSLVIYHGPLCQFIEHPKRHRRWMRNRFPGTLLTGDIIFNQNCYDEMNRKWIDPKYKIEVGIFQIPHHGANNYLLYTLISNYPQVQHWVINFGLGNTHKHPHQSIVNMIESNKMGGTIFSNTQLNVFHYGCLYR